MNDITPHGAPEGVDPKDLASAPSKIGALPIADIPHKPRQSDINPAAARRAERQVSTMFLLSALFVILFVVAYIAIPKEQIVYIPMFGEVSAMNIALGVTFGLAILLIGAAAIQWAKKLMPDVEYVQERHEMASDEATDKEAEEQYIRGRDESGFSQRKIIRRTMIGALALFPIPLVVTLRDLWTQGPNEPSPTEQLNHTMWHDGLRIVVDGTYKPIRPEDLSVGGLITGVPENLLEEQEASGNLNERGKSVIILVRMAPDEIRSQQGPNWDYQGILAYSKICTHVGCPIALYEQRTHHLLCPCHQSTFDLADSGAVIFGPAARNMPQLQIGVDSEGYLVAKNDFTVPVGPSFWERAR